MMPQKPAMPGWVKPLGITGIVLACFGIMGGGQMILMPSILKFQEKIFTALDEQSQKAASSDEGQPDMPISPKAMLGTMKEMTKIPEWFATWVTIVGILKALICGLYLYASIGILGMKRSGVTLFYWASGLSIVLGLTNASVAIMASSLIVIAMMMGGIFGAVIDTVLLVVVATEDKRAFSGAALSSDMQEDGEG